MSNVNNIVEITISDNGNYEVCFISHSLQLNCNLTDPNKIFLNLQVVKLPMLPKVAASNIERCHLLLKKFPFNRGIFEDLSCYIVNPEYLAWTIKLRLPVDGEVVEDNGSSGFVPPTQLVYADVLRNYMEKIVPLNFAVGDITIELRFVSNQEMRLWCVDFVMEPVVRNDLPMPPVLPHIQRELPKPSNASNSTPSNQVCHSFSENTVQLFIFFKVTVFRIRDFPKHDNSRKR